MTRPRTRLSYANVTASLALFVALAGTGTAVMTLPRDSVGPAQLRADAVRASEIAKDAVRSPEIAKDAVRSPEIGRDAVRSPEITAEAVGTSEIRDGSVRLTDLSRAARTALQGERGPAGLRLLTVASVPVPSGCSLDLLGCQDLASVTAVPAGTWSVRADFTLSGRFASVNTCGLVREEPSRDDRLIAENRDLHAVPSGTVGEAAVTLTGVTTTAAVATIGLRCNELTVQSADLTVSHVTLTVLEVALLPGS